MVNSGLKGLRQFRIGKGGPGSTTDKDIVNIVPLELKTWDLPFCDWQKHPFITVRTSIQCN